MARVAAKDAARRIGAQVPQPVMAPGAVAIVAALGALIVASFAVDLQTKDLLVRAFIFAIFAVGFDLLWGYTGILSLGHSAFFGLAAYVIGIAVTQTDGGFGQAMLGLFGGVGLAVILAVVVAWIAFYSRATLFYIAVITLALALVLQQLVSLTGFEEISKYTGGFNGLPFNVVDWSVGQWYWISAAALALVVIGTRVVVASDFGRVLIGIRENEGRLAYLGFRVPLLKLAVFAVSAAVAALAGVAFAAYTQFASPTLLGLGSAVYVIVLVAIGGRGTVYGAVLGAIAIGILGPKISERSPEYWELILGLLFLGSVVFLPRGLYPAITRAASAAWRRAIPAAGGGDEAGPCGSEIVSAREEGSAGRPGEDGLLGRLVGVRKSYGTLKVLDGIDLEMRANEIVCIVGPNGAGKSTLINVVTDSRELTDGEIMFGGVQARSRGPSEIVAMRVGRTFQGTNLMESYTVADSLFVAGLRGRIPSLWRRTHRIEVSAEVEQLVRATGLDRILDARVVDLSHGHRQALELAMALSLSPLILLLDEPTAGLAQDERATVGRLLRDLVTRRRLGIVLIEHDLDFVREITDRVAVLHRGRVEIEGRVDEVVGSPLVREIYLGVAR